MYKGMELPEMTDIVFQDGKHTIYLGDKPLLTGKGKQFTHNDPRVLQQILTDMHLRGKQDQNFICSYTLFEFRVDYLDEGIDFISKHFYEIASGDDLICLKTGSKNKKGNPDHPVSFESIDYEDPLFNTIFWGYSSMITNLNAFIAENMHLVETGSDEDHPFILLLKQYYLQMSDDMRSAVHLLSFIHGSGIVLPVMFVMNRISASEYANGRLAILNRKAKEQVMSDKIKVKFPYEPVDISGMDPGSVFLIFYNGAVQAGDYLALIRTTSDGHPRLPEIIVQGEGNELEFKSTFRWDIKAGKTNPAVERASLKTINAFLNSTGGTLLIGVRDDGSLEGIESDRFVNDDKFLLHVWTLIRTSLGRDVSPYIQTMIEKKEEKTVCIVKCSRSPKPVFLRQPGFNEEFYIRVGPSSNALDISEALRYISVHF
jgi:hypothetical protein